MSQTAVEVQSSPFGGVLGDGSSNYVRSYVNEAAGSIPFGVMVVQGTDDDQALETVASGLAIGVVVHSHRYAKPAQLDDDGLTTLTEMGVLRKGTIFVVPEDDVTPGDAVRVRHTVSGDEILGAFRAAADGNDCAIVANASWLTGASGGSPALLELDLSGTGVLTTD